MPMVSGSSSAAVVLPLRPGSAPTIDAQYRAGQDRPPACRGRAGWPCRRESIHVRLSEKRSPMRPRGSGIAETLDEHQVDRARIGRLRLPRAGASGARPTAARSRRWRAKPAGSRPISQANRHEDEKAGCREIDDGRNRRSHLVGAAARRPDQHPAPAPPSRRGEDEEIRPAPCPWRASGASREKSS